MTESQPKGAPPKGIELALRAFAQPKIATMLVLGFSSGLPFLLVFTTLSVWLRSAGVSRTDIGLMFYVGLAYSIKFLWAPLIDQIRVPGLGRALGRRRSWMLVAQIVVAAALAAMSLCDPAQSLVPLALAAIALAFASATQDICIDAWRIEAVPQSEQGAMVAVYQLGYRLAIIASGAGALYVAQYVSWHAAYLSMSALMLVGMAACLLAPSTDAPEESIAGAETVGEVAEQLHLVGAAARAFGWAYRAIVAPFIDFFARRGWGALLVLALVGSYRLPEYVMGVMANTLYVDLGFSPATIATVVKLFGIWITIGGAFLGGLGIARLGIMRMLAVGIACTVSANLVYAWLATQPGDVGALTLGICVENLSVGLSGTALIAYMSSLTSTHFTATQYALFSSFYALPGKLLGGLSGVIVDWLAFHRESYATLFGGLATLTGRTVGYVPFFLFTASLGIPAIVLLIVLPKRERVPEPA